MCVSSCIDHPWERMSAHFMHFSGLGKVTEVHHLHPIPHGRQGRLHEVKACTWTLRQPGQKGKGLI